MKKSYFTIVGLLIALVALSVKEAQSQTSSSRPRWHFEYRTAYRLAQENDIPLWIHFYSDS